MDIERRWIGPEEARELLEKNNQNRLVSPKLRNRIADDMANGRYRFVGDPIRVAADGTLLDGQHRLLAVIQSETKHEFLVITGLERDTQSVMDTGRSRRLGDVLRINGEKNHTQLAAALPYVWGLENGADLGSLLSHWRPSTAQLLETLARHPAVRDSCGPGHRLRSHMRISGAVATFRHYHFGLIDEEDRDDFWDRLIRRDFHGETDPLGQLYFKVLADAANEQVRRNVVATHALFVKAWNHYRAGSEVKHLKWSRGGRNREEFPEAI